MRTPGCGEGATCTTAATAWVDSNSNSQPTASASAVIRRGASQVGLTAMRAALTRFRPTGLLAFTAPSSTQEEIRRNKNGITGTIAESPGLSKGQAN